VVQAGRSLGSSTAQPASGSDRAAHGFAQSTYETTKDGDGPTSQDLAPPLGCPPGEKTSYLQPESPMFRPATEQQSS